jgi:hypothetical protein
MIAQAPLPFSCAGPIAGVAAAPLVLLALVAGAAGLARFLALDPVMAARRVSALFGWC